jgi:DNA (cytosine-5)-methyltransferase 1
VTKTRLDAETETETLIPMHGGHFDDSDTQLEISTPTYALAGNTIDRKAENGGNGDGFSENISYTLTKTDRHAVCHPINTMTMMGRPSDDLNPRMGLGVGEDCDPCPTLTKAHSHAVAYTELSNKYTCLSCNEVFTDDHATSTDDLAPAECPRCGEEVSIEAQKELSCAVAIATHDVAGTMIARKDSGGFSNSIDHAAAGYMALQPTFYENHPADSRVTEMGVRRLTPTECERLQGFPDGYTNVPSASDSKRYQALGNSMAVPVMQWIGERIIAAIENPWSEEL